MRKFISLFLSITLILSFCNINSFAIGKLSDSELYSLQQYYDEYGAVHEVWVDENGNTDDDPEISNEYISLASDSDLPSTYDSRNYDMVTSVKHQGNFGTCWAHAFCSAAESSLIAQGYATKDNIDLSEAHLAWFTGNSYISSSSIPYELDGLIISDLFSYGGNARNAQAIVARGIGLANEIDYPYNKYSSDTMQFTSGMYDSEYSIKEYKIFTASDVTAIKNTIMTYGSVATSYYHDDAYYNYSDNGFTYYQNVNTGTNHAVTVVGWDDNYSKSNFISEPSSDGAWLVKNSWGTYFGDDGYFWLSYCDTSCTKFQKIVAVPTDEFYENNYQYDGFTSNTYIKYSSGQCYEANIFKSERNEYINAVGFYTTGTGQTCTISVYKNLTSSTNPKSGTLLESKTVDCTYSGYYNIGLDNEYLISSGTTFSVVLKFTSSGVAYCNFEGSTRTSGNFNYYFSSSKGQSFYSTNGSSWSDASSTGNNIPIKVFTNNVVTQTGISIKSLPTKTEYYVGDTFSLNGLKLYADYSDGTSKLISSGYAVSGYDMSLSGTQTVTVSYSDFTATFSITVLHLEITDVNIASLPSKTTYTTLDELDLSGLTLNVSYNNGTVKSISDGFTVTGYDNTVSGTQTISVEYSGFTTEFTLIVLQGYADYSVVDDLIDRVSNMNLNLYTDDTVSQLNNALNSVVRSLKNTQQSTVDEYALNINSALSNLVLKPTTFTPTQDSVTTFNSESQDIIICGLAPNLTIDELIEQFFSTENVYAVSDDEKIGTGSVITFKSSLDDTVLVEYTALIYGDTNGDSVYDGTDSVIVSCIANGMLTKQDVGEVVYNAADCDHNGIVDEADVIILQNSGVKLDTVIQN